MKYLLKKTSSAIAFLILGITLSIPAPAHAQFTTFEVNPAVIAGIAATAVNTTAQNVGVTPKFALDALAWTVAKMTVQSITRSTVNWINSGFNGSPAFVSDLNQNLKYLGDSVADDFFNHLNQTTYDATGFNITSPFQDQLNQALRQEYYRTTSSFGLNYTLYQDSSDPRAFINGDFSKGGFNAFLSSTHNPANNPFGAYMLASNALWSQVDAAAKQRRAELDWGKGFLPWRGNCTAASSNSYNAEMAAAFPDAFSGATAPVSLSQAEKCTSNPVKTPGSVIESQLEQNLGTGVRQLELADSINEIVGALMGQLVNQVLGSGGLLGASQPSAGGGSSYIDQATSATQYNNQAASLAGGVQQNITGDITTITTYRDDWQKILTAANSAQQTCGASSEITQVVTQANTGVNRGNTALAQLQAVQAQVQSASQSPSNTTSTQVVSAVSSYQSYLSSSNTPTPTELANAATLSADTDNGGTASTSLYLQMTDRAKNCSR